METAINKENCYWEVTLACPSTDFEMLSFYLFEHGADGVEEVSEIENVTHLKAFFQDPKMMPETLIAEIVSRCDFSKEKIKLLQSEKKPVENWQTNWKEFFKPLFIGNDFVIRPPWEKGLPGRKEIVIEPGLGFGTGYHESTRLAVEMISSIGDFSELPNVIDIGTGSGILAIASLLQNASKVIAIDIDENSLNEVPNNLKLSGLNPSRCTVRNIEPHQLDEPANVVIANITADVILKIKDDIDRLTLPGGFILLSGIFYEFYVEIKTEFQSKNNLIDEKNEGEWHSLLFKKR